MSLVAPVMLRYAPLALLGTNGIGFCGYSVPIPIPFVLGSPHRGRIEGLNGAQRQNQK